MAKPKSKQVPLVIYKSGERIEIGMASVATDGFIVAQIKKDVRQDIKDIIYGDLGDLSLNPKAPLTSPYHNNVRVMDAGMIQVTGKIDPNQIDYVVDPTTPKI